MISEPEASILLASVGLRSTEPRRRILSAIQGAGSSLSHRELVDMLAGLDRVTIYRNLKTLRRKGLVHGVQGVDGILRYLVNPDRGEGCPGGHPHFLCSTCGRMSCLTDQVLPSVALPRGTLVHGKQFLVYGTCPECALSFSGKQPRRSGRAQAS